MEGLELFSFYGATSTSRFDQYSRILPSYQIASNCAQYATAPAAGCSARWPGAASQSVAAAARQADKSSKGSAPRDVTRIQGELRRRRVAQRARGSGQAPAPQSPQQGKQRPKLGPLELPKLPDLPLKLPGNDKNTNDVLDFLLGK